MKKLEEYVEEYISERYMDDDEYADYKSRVKTDSKKNLSDKDNDTIMNVENWYDDNFKRNETEEFIIDKTGNVAINSKKDLILKNRTWEYNNSGYFNEIHFEDKKLLDEFLNNCENIYTFPQNLTVKEDNFMEDFPITIAHAKGVNFAKGCNLWSLSIEGNDNMIITFDDINLPPAAQKFDITAPNAVIIFNENIKFEDQDDGEAIFIKCKELTGKQIESQYPLDLKIQDKLSIKEIILNDNGNTFGATFSLDGIKQDLKVSPMKIYSNDSVSIKNINDDSLSNIDLSGCTNDIIISKSNIKVLPKLPASMSKNTLKLISLNALKTLEGCPNKCKNFICTDCNMATLHGGPKYAQKYECTDCLNLVTLEGGPKVADSFNCERCRNLESFEGAPEDCEVFNATECENITSLDYVPMNLDSLNVTLCGKEFTKEEIIKHLK